MKFNKLAAILGADMYQERFHAGVSDFQGEKGALLKIFTLQRNRKVVDVHEVITFPRSAQLIHVRREWVENGANLYR
jgi:hypothetical protein